MSEIINKFDILSKLNEDFKREIKGFGSVDRQFFD
jgi:hypothetical protein